jgi:1,4-dihydroxy-2-naphthoate octaprenyltransferase
MHRSATVGDVALILRLGRMHFLLPGALLYIMGALLAELAGAPLSVSRLVFGYMVFMPAHLSVSYSNDYHDAESDGYGSPTPFSGGSGVLVHYPHLRPAAKRLALGLIAASFALGVLFVIAYSFPAWLLVYLALGNLLGWFYAASPLRLSYRGLGEVSTAFTVGLLIPALGYMMIRGHAGPPLGMVIPGSLLCGIAFILAVQIPDLEADRLAQKHTFVSRVGRRVAFAGVGTALSLATVWLLTMPEVRLRPLGLFCLLPALTGMWGALCRPVERDAATRLVNLTLTALIIFLILSDVYLAWLLRTG